MKRKPGRPAFAPTKAQREQVEHWAAAGVPQKTIAILIGVANDTLRKHFIEQLDNGRWRAFGDLYGKAYSLAMAGDKLLLIYLMRCIGPEEFKQRAGFVPPGANVTEPFEDYPDEKLAPALERGAQVLRFRAKDKKATA